MNQKIALKYGIIAGVGAVAYLLLFYLINPRLMLSAGVIWSTLILYLVGMYLATARTRDRADYFPFHAAVRPPFLVYVLATVIYSAFYYLMFNVIDPDLLDVQLELLRENAQRMADLTGEKKIKGQIENLSLEDIQVTVRNVALAAGRSVLGGFILSLILAGLMRRD